ncbi:MAG TPA: insulinase family protein [Ignavibacteria bacterium]|nr:insulinase family protein [Ignavibacteria bacterium]
MSVKIKRFKTTFLYAVLILILTNTVSFSQSVNKVSDGKYEYETVENDPLKARIYTLENGLKVYLTVNKSTPRIQTYVAVATGSKNDPHDAQGLSHYLEHMVFKGTDKYGTKDYEKEKPLLDTIIALYEKRRVVTDPTERKAIYHLIDSVSYLASEYAIANEYDKMISSIGAQGTNAYTSFEQTVYVNDIPSNQMEKWLKIESERFRNPVMRLFHTELEAVYEEKNSDDDNDKVWEAFLESLFPTHTYGTQTTIGSVEQLKNPSIQKIIDYYNERYVPNNMAICLSGDLDPDETIILIDKYFGKLSNKTVPEFIPPTEAPILSPVVRNVTGPSQEFVRFGYRFQGEGSKDADILTMLDNILSNGSAGLIDLNLDQEQKVIQPYSATYLLKDYSIFYLGGKPREGQTLYEVKDLLLQQIELVKEGKFPDWLIPSIISNLKLNQIRSLEDNGNRADIFVNSFISGIPYEKYIFNIDRLAGITKEDVVNFAKKNLNENYVIVYKNTGIDNSIEKVEKPEISPVKVNREDISEFAETVMTETTEDIQPVFVDFKKEITELKLKNNVPLYYLQNKENELYELYYLIELGTNQNKKLSLAIQYLDYLGTSKFTPAQFKEEFYKYAGSYSFSVNEDQVTVSMTGLSDNFDKSLRLLEELFSDPKGNDEILGNLINDILTQRENAKLSKNIILRSGLLNYAKYGKDNPFTYRLSESELKKVKASELIDIIKEIMNYKQRVLYYGPQISDVLVQTLDIEHKTPAEFKTAALKNEFKELPVNENEVYAVNYDMQQAEIIMLSKSVPYDKNKIPVIQLYNQYFDGGMQSIVFQELRESKALAYSAYSAYQSPLKKERSNFIIAYIGTQADKLPEAMASMTQILNNMPESENIFSNAKTSLMKQIQSDRYTNSAVLFQYEALKKLGIDTDIRKDIYQQIPSMSFSDIKSFQNKYVKDKKYKTLVLGDLKNLDMKELEKYGKVKILTLQEIFGY